MCKWGTTVPLFLKIPADLSSTGQECWKVKQIDACIAPLVSALQGVGIDMRSSCCGHGKVRGEIILQEKLREKMLQVCCDNCPPSKPCVDVEEPACEWSQTITDRILALICEEIK